MGIHNGYGFGEQHGEDAESGSRKPRFPPCVPAHDPGLHTVPRIDLGRLMPSSGHLPMLSNNGGVHRGNAKMSREPKRFTVRAIPGGFEQRPIPKAEANYLDKAVIKPGFHLPDVRDEKGIATRHMMKIRSKPKDIISIDVLNTGEFHPPSTRFEIPPISNNYGRVSPRSQTSTPTKPKLEKRQHSPAQALVSHAESHTSVSQKGRRLPPISKAGSKRRHLH